MTERHHTANACQRSRRARNPRIDYYPNPEALAAIDAKRAEQRPRSVSATNRAVLDAIITEWAELTGIKKPRIDASKTSAGSTGIDRHKRAHAYDFGAELSTWAASWLAPTHIKETSRRVVCGARQHRDGQPCQAKSELGKRRCRFHGGLSTGPTTTEGKKTALLNLKQFQAKTG